MNNLYNQLANIFDKNQIKELANNYLIEPINEKQILDLISLANIEHLSLLPRGSNTNLKYSIYPNKEKKIIISTLRLQKINIEIDNLLVECECGVTGRILTDALNKLDLIFPPIPSNFQECTIGGMLAVRTKTYRRLHRGDLSDYLLALRIITSEGKILHTGTKTVKNVSGYDIMRLYSGLISKITLKLLPKPPAPTHIIASFETLTSLYSATEKLKYISSLKVLDWIDLSNISSPVRINNRYLLLCELETLEHLYEEYNQNIKNIIEKNNGQLESDFSTIEKIWEWRLYLMKYIIESSADYKNKEIILINAYIPNKEKIKIHSELEDLRVVIWGHIIDNNWHIALIVNEDISKLTKQLLDIIYNHNGKIYNIYQRYNNTKIKIKNSSNVFIENQIKKMLDNKNILSNVL